jgi:LPS-assembly protein
LPIIDIATGTTLERTMLFNKQSFKQTLEPQIYYTYIPYRRQSNIPLFDTSVNTPVYDQLFNYNRFSGLDRIGDANQVGVGINTRLIDEFTGMEKVRLGIGEILYFADREVTLCNSKEVCNDYPGAHANTQRLSPLTGTLDYHLPSSWNLNSNVSWDPVSKQMTTASIAFHYQPETTEIFNLGFNYVNRTYLASINIIPETNPNSGLRIPNEPLKITDLSFAWPITSHVATIGRVSHDFASNRLQNVLYGVEYDSCCISVRLVGNRTFLGIDPNRNDQPRYTNEFYIQLSLKGLGNVGNGNPQSLLNHITGYTSSQFT